MPRCCMWQANTASGTAVAAACGLLVLCRAGTGAVPAVAHPRLLALVRRYAGGDSIKHTVFDNVDRATLKVYSSQENVAGVKIPKFESVSEPGETKMELTGMMLL